MKALKVTGGLLFGLFLLAVMGYSLLCFINWEDRPPSAAALEFRRIVAARPEVAPADNAVVYLLGFAAPEGADPVEVGTRRMAWLEAYDGDKDQSPDPLPEELHFRDQSSPGLKSLWETCSADVDRIGCAGAFDSAARDWKPNDMDALALQRYEALLARHAWRDAVPLDLTAPLPPYVAAMHAQRLYLLRARQLVAGGRLDETRAMLSADLAYWRGAVPASDQLISMMIGIEALRSRFFYSNLILRGLPAAEVARVMPADWSREFSAAERSMYRVMAGEVAFTADALKNAKGREILTQTAADFDFEPPNILETWMARLSDPLFKVQDTLNGMAQQRLKICEDFEAPMRQYLQLRQDWIGQPVKPFSLYNPTGLILVRMEAGDTYVQYALRTASVEGMRRAALLAARLHASGASADAAPGEIARADLRDPYTDKPFEWNAARRSVNFLAPEKSKRKVEYFY